MGCGMVWRKRLLWGVLILAAVGALAYSQRLLLLQYSLGWYTDWNFPRGPEQPIAWQAGPAQAATPAAQRPPNIIVILADDLGFNDITAYGGGRADWGVPTPHIDRIAQQGVRFDTGYAPSAICTISRAALLTGRYPWRFGLEFTPTPGPLARVAGQLFTGEPPVHIDLDTASRVPKFNDLGMPAEEVTLAEVLRQRGYHTVHIGKWHLGSTPVMRPNAQGFDESLFLESGLYLRRDDPRAVNAVQEFDPMDRFMWPNMRFGVSYNAGAWFEPRRYLTDYFTDQAVQVIERNRHRPFFLYLAHWAVHTPLQASREDYEALPKHLGHRERVYGAMIRSLDRSVGRVLDSLREQGLLDNTLVIFTSDNGGPHSLGIPSLNRPFRGWKLSFFEGGIRVPYLAQWPARIRPGQVLQTPVSGMDVFATAAAAAAAPLPKDRPIDAQDWLPWLQAGARAPERPLHWRDGPYRALREQDWKLIVSARPQRDWLFNLAQDPTEQHDLSDREPARVAAMKARMAAHHQGMPAPMWPSFIQVPVTIDKTLDQPSSAQDVHTYWYN